MYKVLHLATTIRGGAQTITRLHKLFLKTGIESCIVNPEYENVEEKIIVPKKLKNLSYKVLYELKYRLFNFFIRMRYKKTKEYFSYNKNFYSITASDIIEACPFKPDFIFLHWIANFITTDLIVELYEHYKCPIIWRYNDYVLITGGCHYPGTCTKYLIGCGECPILNSKTLKDPSFRHFSEKKKMISKINISIVDSTHHTEAVVATSPLYASTRKFFIRNSHPSAIFFPPVSKKEAKEKMGIPADHKVIFWGARYIEEPRKGFAYLKEALTLLPDDNITILIAGNKLSDKPFNFRFPTKHIGMVNEEALARCYQAADVLAVTSIEDGGPMMIIESMMCATPVVSFATGLALEVVITGETGYRAIKSDPKDLAKGLLNILNLQPSEYQRLSEQSYQKAMALYSEETEITAYKQLFTELFIKKDA